MPPVAPPVTPMLYDVAVVGFGPVGAAAAALLGAAGHRVAVVEREAAPFPLPRAIHLDDEALRLLQRLGVADAVRAEAATADAYRFTDRDGRLLLAVDRRADRQPLGWPPMVFIRQPDLEAHLRRAVARFPNVAVALGAGVVALAQDDEGATLTLAGGGTLRARYVLACDGARSAVRDAAGLGLRRLARADAPWLVVDVRLTRPVALPEAPTQVCDPAGPVTFIPRPGRADARWEFRLNDGETADAATRPEAVRARLAPWVDPDAVEVERAAVYAFGAAVAPRWRAGRVLLAGDAAHQMPPFAGQGLCSGLRDAATAAWMLDLVLRRRAAPRLLDAYGAERGRHVAEVTALSLAAGALLGVRRPALAALRDGALRLAAPLSLGRTRRLAVPMPPLRRGLVVRGTIGRRAGGTRFPQPRVRLAPTAPLVGLDEALGDGFALVGYGVDPRTRMSESDAAFWARLGARALVVQSTGTPATGTPATSVTAHAVTVLDPEGALGAWFARYGADVAIVRPDRYVAAAFRRDRSATACLRRWMEG